MNDFPVGGPRDAVYNALRSRGFVMSGFSDKHWTRHDGLNAHVYGAGSMLSVRAGDTVLWDCKMAEALAKVDERSAATA